MFGARIVGIGVALPGTNCPGRIVTNEQLSGELLARRDALHRRGKLLSPEQWAARPPRVRTLHQRRWEQFETDGEWIESHTGIRERRIADPSVATSDLAIVAGKVAMRVAGWDPQTVDCVLVATVWPDNPATPPTVAYVQHGLGIPARDDGGVREIDGFDVSCACSSFGKALKIGYAFIRGGFAKRILVIGADVMSRTVNPNSRNLLPILADAGGAIALEQTTLITDAFLGPQGFLGGLDGSLAGLIVTPSGGTRRPIEASTALRNPFNPHHRMVMAGLQVKKEAERLLLGFRDQNGIVANATRKAGIPLAVIDLIALHQANLRINEPVAKKLVHVGFTGTVYHNVMRFGNTTSASIPLLLFDAWQEGVLQPGQLVLQVVFGGGFSWETSLYRWTLPRCDVDLSV